MALFCYAAERNADAGQKSSKRQLRPTCNFVFILLTGWMTKFFCTSSLRFQLLLCFICDQNRIRHLETEDGPSLFLAFQLINQPVCSLNILLKCKCLIGSPNYSIELTSERLYIFFDNVFLWNYLCNCKLWRINDNRKKNILRLPWKHWKLFSNRGRHCTCACKWKRPFIIDPQGSRDACSGQICYVWRRT